MALVFLCMTHPSIFPLQALWNKMPLPSSSPAHEQMSHKAYKIYARKRWQANCRKTLWRLSLNLVSTILSCELSQLSNSLALAQASHESLNVNTCVYSQASHEVLNITKRRRQRYRRETSGYKVPSVSSFQQDLHAQ